MGGITIKQNTLTGRTIGPGRQVGHGDISIGTWEAFLVVGGVANADVHWLSDILSMDNKYEGWFRL